MTRLISGLIRQKGHSRGADNKRLLTLSGSSTAIRLNEKIIYYVNEATKLATNGAIDVNDVARKADLLLQNGLSALTSEGIITAANLTTNSDVENFISSIAIEYGEAQDLCNLEEEQTNGEIFVDVNDAVQFRHQLQPFSSGKGFAIKNKSAATDNADDTCYLRGKSWDYTESCLKSDSYSSRVYGILPAESLPSTAEDLGAVFNNYRDTNTGETASRFRPTHGRFLPGDFYLAIIETFGTAAAEPIPFVARFRVCADNAGVPLNAAGIIANIDFDPSQFQRQPTADPTTKSGIANTSVFFNPAGTQINSFNLDTRKDYWLICSSANTVPLGSNLDKAVRWESGTKTSRTVMTAARGTSTDTAGGSGWISSGLNMAWEMPLVRSQPFECSDPKAIAAIGSGLSPSGGSVIESTLTNMPATIRTRDAMYRYLVNQLYYMARPRANWNMATVTAPNVPIMPGDPIMISDSVMGFSTAGTQAVMTTCGDMTYSWQIGDYQAPTILSIQPVSIPTRYK